jgi:hypothetical protein
MTKLYVGQVKTKFDKPEKWLPYIVHPKYHGVM